MASPLALGATMLVLALSATPAGAVVAKIGGRGYGLTPIRGVNAARLPAVKRALGALKVSATGPVPYDKAGQLVNHGGPVMHSVTTHVVYWDPSGEFTSTTKGIVHEFFADVAHDSGLGTNVWGVAGQYSDKTGHSLYSSTFGTEETDKTVYPASGCEVPPGGDQGPPYLHCLMDGQLRSELSSYIAAHSLPKGPAQQYFVLFPHKVDTCLEEEFEGELVCSNNAVCAYHSFIGAEGPGEIIYSDIPFSLLDEAFAKGCQSDGNANRQLPNDDGAGTNAGTRFADIALKYTSHEYIEASTDPRLNAWFENELPGQEIGDKCNATGSGSEPGEDPNAFLPTLGGKGEEGTLFDQTINSHNYYIQSEWDNAAKACGMKPVPISSAEFSSSPTSGVTGTPISFTGTATDVYAGLGFSWNWGDGTESAGATLTHVYGAPGSYEVTMIARDELTSATVPPVAHTIVVDDPATASFSISPNPTSAGVPVAFNGSASSDPDGSIPSYAWNFGDGSAGSGVAPSHPYAAPGGYTVTLTVTDSGGQTGTASQTVTVGPAPQAKSSAAPPNSSFTQAEASFNLTTGLITFTATVGDPGTFSWLLTFQNGKFGVFAASNHKCKARFVRLGGKCRPSRIVFAKGSQAVARAGAVTLKLKPSASALKALKNALKQKKGLPVAATFTFQSARGGSPVSRTQSLTVKLKKK